MHTPSPGHITLGQRLNSLPMLSLRLGDTEDGEPGYAVGLHSFGRSEAEWHRCLRTAALLHIGQRYTLRGTRIVHSNGMRYLLGEDHVEPAAVQQPQPQPQAA